MKKQQSILGFDEVGRGCLAGPIVVACVLENFNAKKYKPLSIFIRDSKKMTRIQREKASIWIRKNFKFGLGKVESWMIDEIGITQATKLAAAEALADFILKYGEIIDVKKAVDGQEKWFEDCEAIIKGDDKVFEISQASIIAKVYRDNFMKELGKKYIDWKFENHVGYGTKFHCEMIKKNGLLPEVHRKSFCRRLI